MIIIIIIIIVVIIWLLHILVEASFNPFRYLLLGDQNNANLRHGGEAIHQVSPIMYSDGPITLVSIYLCSASRPS